MELVNALLTNALEQLSPLLTNCFRNYRVSMPFGQQPPGLQDSRIPRTSNELIGSRFALIFC